MVGVGSVFVSMSMSDKVSAGASGAIFGLAGIMLVAGYLHRGAIPLQWGRAFGRGMLPVIVLNLALGGALHQWVDNWAHLGGLVTGCILALLIALRTGFHPWPAYGRALTRAGRNSNCRGDDCGSVYGAELSRFIRRDKSSDPGRPVHRHETR